MKRISEEIRFNVPAKIYLKDPESSNLGRRIIEHSILLIEEIGFEAFTFKKLGERIGSNESSVYRYFESKHNLLLYLSSWYWSWKEHMLVLETYNMTKPEEILKKAIEVLTETVKEDSNFTHVNEVILNNIIINENPKSFLTKEVDQENEEGYFVVYKRIITRMTEMISAVNSAYPYPTSLASTIIEGGLHQHFLKSHFRSITDCNKKTTVASFFIHLTFQALTSH